MNAWTIDFVPEARSRSCGGAACTTHGSPRRSTDCWRPARRHLPDSACYGACVIDELVHAQLLAARGRVTDAAKLRGRPQVYAHAPLLPLDALRALERARVHEQLGNRETALAAYAFVATVWANADPELKPYVDEARAGLARLGGEPRR